MTEYSPTHNIAQTLGCFSLTYVYVRKILFMPHYEMCLSAGDSRFNI